MTDKDRSDLKEVEVYDGLIPKVWKTISEVIMRTPESLAAAAWRLVAISTLSSALFSGWLLWRYPDVFGRFVNGLDGADLQRVFRRQPALREEAMALISSFLREYGPDEIALVSWVNQGRIETIWSRGDSTAHYPTPTDGAMHHNMLEAVGSMVFSRCWSGELIHHQPARSALSEQHWGVCGFSNNERVWGYLMVYWGDGMTAERREGLRILGESIEQVLRS